MPDIHTVKLLRCVLRTSIIFICVAAEALADDVCESIMFDSAGEYKIRHDAIEQRATSHGLNAVVDYLLIKPRQEDIEAGGIERIILISNDNSRIYPNCETVEGVTKISLSCARKITNSNLMVIVHFTVDHQWDAISKTDDIASYIRDRVICEKVARKEPV